MWLMLFLLFMPASCFEHSEKDNGDIVDDWIGSEEEGLCGVYSLFSVLQSLGENLNLEELLRPEFCNTGYGSSAANLIAAGEKFGLKSILVSSVSVDEMRLVSVPAILHVRPRSRADIVSHWIAYLGMDSAGRYLIVDPSFGPEAMSPSELASRFDGTAILYAIDASILRQQVNTIRRNRFGNSILTGSFLFLAVVVLRFASNRWPSKSSVLFVLYFIFSIVVAIGYHIARPDGLLGDSTGVARRLAENSNAIFEVVDNSTINSVISEKQSDVAILDARWPAAFAAGSIPGALSYPISIKADDEVRLAEDLRQMREIIVFCQSERCRYAEIIARRLYSMGFRNVKIYGGGYQEWKEGSK